MLLQVHSASMPGNDLHLGYALPPLHEYQHMEEDLVIKFCLYTQVRTYDRVKTSRKEDTHKNTSKERYITESTNRNRR